MPASVLQDDVGHTGRGRKARYCEGVWWPQSVADYCFLVFEKKTRVASFVRKAGVPKTACRLLGISRNPPCCRAAGQSPCVCVSATAYISRRDLQMWASGGLRARPSSNERKAPGRL